MFGWWAGGPPGQGGDEGLDDDAGLMERAGREGWALHFAELDIDTSTPASEIAANIIISGSQ